MSVEELVHHSELKYDVYSPSAKAYYKQKEGGQQGIRVVSQPEQSENPKETKDRSDVAERLLTSQHSQASAEIDLRAVQEYISQLPEALVPEFALLLAQRMKQQIRTSGKLSEQDAARAQAESSPDGRKQTREHAARVTGRLGRSESITALRYIVTTHPSYPDRSIKHTVGEPELIPYIPPGLYRETIGGTMELESSFRRSVVEPKEEPKDGSLTNPVPIEQGRLRKMMSKVFKRQTRN
jgi:hypothetical protein